MFITYVYNNIILHDNIIKINLIISIILLQVSITQYVCITNHKFDKIIVNYRHALELVLKFNHSLKLPLNTGKKVWIILNQQIKPLQEYSINNLM